jgi:uncharacterized protein YggE
MRMRISLLTLPLIATAVLLAGCSTPSETVTAITVSGTGEVSVPPDVVTVTVGVQTHNRDVTTAVHENNAVAAAIMDAARQSGVSDADMQTTYFNVYPQREYDSFGQPTGQVTYLVDNNLTVKLRDVGRLSELLQGAVDAGATNIYGVTFAISDSSQQEAAARDQAMADALDQAQKIAAQMGVRLGEPIMISTGTTIPVPTPYFGEAAMGIGGGGGPPIATGANKVTVNVTVSYAFR